MAQRERECRVEPKFESNHSCVCKLTAQQHELGHTLHECALCNARWYDDGSEVW